MFTDTNDIMWNKCEYNLLNWLICEYEPHTHRQSQPTGWGSVRLYKSYKGWGHANLPARQVYMGYDHIQIQSTGQGEITERGSNWHGVDTAVDGVHSNRVQGHLKRNNI